MNPLAAFFASIGLLLPAWAGGALPAEDPPQKLAEGAVQPTPGDSADAMPSSLQPMNQVKGDLRWGQVRIERRVIIRVSPRPGPARRSMMASLDPADVPRTRIVERPAGDCLPMSSIAASNPQGEKRLLFYLRDRRLVAATLEKSCSAQDFYSGFYVERSDDGRLCIDRDKLQARGGAKCSVSELNQLVRVVE